MTRRSPPYLSLAKIDRWLPLMRKQGVSEVARSPRGFLAAYRRAGGDPRRLSEAWRRRRDGFVARHMAQVEQSGEPLTTPEGLPTRRHLALIAWAYCPTPVRPPRANPSADERRRAAERSGDPVAVLRERLRRGEVTTEQVRIAAALGDERALALEPGRRDHDVVDDVGGIRLVGRALRDPHGLAVSVAADAAESVLPLSSTSSGASPRRAIDLARRWVRDRRGVSAESLRDAMNAAAAAALRATDDGAYVDEMIAASAALTAQTAMAAADEVSRHVASAAGAGRTAGLAAMAVRRAVWARADSGTGAEEGEDDPYASPWLLTRLIAYVLREIPIGGGPVVSNPPNPPFYVYAPQQKIGSAGTSLAQVPALHKHLVAKGLLTPGMRALDLGGGRYDKGVEFLGEHGVDARVYDPFNRLAGHNEAVARWVDSRHRGVAGVDAVLCSNVLNVIREKVSRAQVIRAARSALAPGGVAYFWVHEGSPDDRKKGPRATAKGWQNFKLTKFYLPEVRKVFPRARISGRLIVAPL
ncbi:MAG: hypothetical protein IT371_30755 [Deltaproteobacteria bacterium]|nr:hypothetical protein [Deltaproteobacteria bacterium]